MTLCMPCHSTKYPTRCGEDVCGWGTETTLGLNAILLATGSKCSTAIHKLFGGTCDLSELIDEFLRASCRSPCVPMNAT